MTIKNRIKEYMNKTNLNQKQLADKLGVSSVYLSNLINNKSSTPKADIMFKLAQFFNVEINELFYIEEQPIEYDKEIKKLFNLLDTNNNRALNQEYINQIIKYQIEYLKQLNKNDNCNINKFIKHCNNFIHSSDFNKNYFDFFVDSIEQLEKREYLISTMNKILKKYLI